jgi:tetrapyrrole methylase family protein/MazG family protein
MDKTLTHFQSKFQTLVEIVARLRGPEGCPWDKVQTQNTLTPYIIEEAYELVEAIESGDQPHIQEELGDFLFQVVLQAQVAQDEGYFELGDVLEGLCKKLVHRHPHVFKQGPKQNIEEVWKNWHKLKAEEDPKNLKPIFNYPKSLPSLQAAAKIGQKTKAYRFDWSEPQEVFAKIQEEVAELQETLKPTKSQQDKKAQQHEIGDVLFSVAQLSRHLGLDPEAALREGNRRFEKRFLKVLELSGKNQEDFAALSVEQKENLWQQAKRLTDEESRHD